MASVQQELCELVVDQQATQLKAILFDDDDLFGIGLYSILSNCIHCTELINMPRFDHGMTEQLPQNNISVVLVNVSVLDQSITASIGMIREVFSAARVVAVCDVPNRVDILLALQAGVHGFVPKRLNVRGWTHALRIIMDGAIYVPPSLAEMATLKAHRPLASLGIAFPTTGGLTPRQQDVLQLLVQGKANKEIARSLLLSEGTVKIHLAAIFRHLGVSNRAAAAVTGARLLVPTRL